MTCGRADGSFAQFMYFHQCQTWASQTGLAKKDLGPIAFPSLKLIDYLPTITGFWQPPIYIIYGSKDGLMSYSETLASLVWFLSTSFAAHFQKHLGLFGATAWNPCFLKGRSLCGGFRCRNGVPKSYGFGNQLPNS